jgi:hypothetical protein
MVGATTPGLPLLGFGALPALPLRKINKPLAKVLILDF